MSLTSAAPLIRRPRFPRVSGDEPAADALAHVTIKFSPRERG